jgi:hypothetical protein
MKARISRRRCRIIFIAVIALLLIVPANSYVNSAGGTDIETQAAQQASIPFEEREPIAPPRENVTVYTGQGFVPPGGFDTTTWADNALIAIASDGRLLHYEAEHDAYQDVDPSPEGDRTVLFAASDHVEASECGATVDCQRDSVIRLNLTTGERETLYAFTAPRRVNNKLHDVDRIGEHTYVLAGMAYDRIYVVNATIDIVEWQWDVQQRYNFSGGRSYPSDWTHINDVEYLPHKGENGWFMASLRNQDQVVFVDREEGLVENWTLGVDDAHRIINEQHNPDYIPASEGGPAVMIADSQNNRIVEYQRVDGEWERTWTWSESEMNWPRDADRLPDGNTLVSDTNGNRLLEVNESGDVVWEVDVGSVYEAERLGTGDESTGVASARELGLESRRTDEIDTSDRSIVFRVQAGVLSALPEKVVNGIYFVLPRWVDFIDAVAIAGILAVVLLWGLLELWWSPFSLRPQSPIRVERNE